MARQEAVVCGASMGGLLAARVLADTYDSVTVVERDELPADASQRAGVPQGHHLHMMTSAGLKILDEMFPGATAELRAAGAPIIDTHDLSAVYVEVRGHPLCRTGALADPDAMPVQPASRPLLEYVVRERVCALPNVTVMDRHDVVEPVLTDRAVTGVRISDRIGNTCSTLPADLVVDATGRSARTPAFLAAHGFTRPVERSYRVELCYASQLFRLAPGALCDKVVFVSPTLDRSTGVGMLAYENDTMIVTLIGVAGHRLPTGLPELLAAVAQCVPPRISAALADAEPLGETHHRQFPTSVWRRYDKLPSFPQGLLVIGDAVCSLNPMYGQGMTSALIQARSLRRSLAFDWQPSSQAYFRDIARRLSPLWWANRLNDFGYTPVSGWRSLPQRVFNGYTTAYMAAASTDIALTEAFLRMLQGVDPATTLMRPGHVARGHHQQQAHRSVVPCGWHASEDVAGGRDSTDRWERQMSGHEGLTGRRQFPQKFDPYTGRLFWIMFEPVVPLGVIESRCEDSVAGERQTITSRIEADDGVARGVASGASDDYSRRQFVLRLESPNVAAVLIEEP